MKTLKIVGIALLFAIFAIAVASNARGDISAETISWTTKAPMPTSRWGAGAAAVGGKIYVVGGSHGTASLNTKNEMYDPFQPGARNSPSQWSMRKCTLSGVPIPTRRKRQ